MKNYSVILREQGSHEVMKIEENEISSPDGKDVLIQQSAIGLNYIDTYHRSGLYKLPLPTSIGMEAAGKVIEVGNEVKDFKVGDRVAYGFALGAYTNYRLINESKLVKLPDEISEDQAAAISLKGMTVEYLFNRAYPLKKDELALFYAASGGVGHLAGQWAKKIGAKLIGVTSGQENCRIAKENGFFYTIDRTKENIEDRVQEISEGKGVSVVFDSVGKDSFDISINSLSPRGYFISYGNTTGDAPAVSPSLLQKKGSLYFTRPSIANYVQTRDELLLSYNRVFDLMKSNDLKVNISQKRNIKDIANVHKELESGELTGSTILHF